MKQKRAGGWGYYFVAGVAVLACNRTAGCMLHSVPFSALLQIVGCMLESVHLCAVLVRIAGCMLESVHPCLALVLNAGYMLERVHPCPALVRIAGCMLERVHPAPPPSRVHMRMYLEVGCWAGFVKRGRSSFQCRENTRCLWK